MRILSRYFVVRFLGLFAVVLAAALLVLAAIELVLNIDDAVAPDTRQSGDPFAAIRFLGLRLATYYLADLIPIASFIAAFTAFAISGRTLELVALQANGIRLARVVLPVLASAVILSLATGVLHETVILRAEQTAAGAKPVEARLVEFRNAAFWMHRGPLIAKVGQADPESRRLHEIEIYERTRTGAIVRVIRGEQGRVTEDGQWRIESARVWHFDPEDAEAAPVMEEGADFVLDLATLDATVLQGADPALLPIADLGRYLEGGPAGNPGSVRRLEARFHERLASPWLVVVFAWLAVPFALRVDQRGRLAGPAVSAVVVLALYLVTQTAGQSLAQQELFPVGLAPWLTMMAFTAAGGLAFARGR